jgi:hypothetical protein
MLFYDRNKQKEISEDELPDHLDLGRYLIYKDQEHYELTYSQYSTNKVIRQELLLEKNKNIQDIFIDIFIDIEKSPQNTFEVIPLIRRIKNKLNLNNFEQLLYDKIFHIEEIFRQPHYVLKREIEKVHVSRAKRIPSKSYQYLASHTEDWISKSIVSFKPSRILNEELELNFNIYENQLTVSFIERCLTYLNSRLKEIQDIKKCKKLYNKLLKYRNDQDGWYKKVERNLELIGSVYEDEYYKGESKNSSTLSKTEETLSILKKRLLLLRKSDLFTEVDKRTTNNVSLKNTNVLVNHKHYRYIKTLWVELNKLRPEKTEEEKIIYEQNVIKGVSDYANSLITYCLKNYLGYNIIGSYSKYSCDHQFYPKITFQKNDKGIFNFSIENNKLNFIVLASEPNTIISNRYKNTIVLYYSENLHKESNHFIPINPLDPDSAERVSKLFRKYIIIEYLKNLNNQYDFRQLLRDYIHIIKSDYLEFSKQKFKYQFLKYPINNLNENRIIALLEDDEKFKGIKSRLDRDRLIKEMSGLIKDINKNSAKVKNDYLYCLGCHKKLSEREILSFNYIKCGDCNTVIDSSNQFYKLEISNPTLDNLNAIEWGMDYIEFKPEEL